MPIVIPPPSPVVAGPTTTAQAVINRACDLFGYKDPSESLSAADSTAFLAVLNDMIDGWNTQRLYIAAVTEIVATVSTSPITIGPGGTINVNRPVKMEDGAFIRQNGSDYQVLWMSRTDYADITNKAQTGELAYAGFYDPAIPVGSIYLWPKPAGSVELHLQLQTQLTEFANLTAAYSLAPGYRKALSYSLAEELAPGKRELPASTARIAASARRAIRRSNVVIPDLDIGQRSGGGLADFLSGL